MQRTTETGVENIIVLEVKCFTHAKNDLPEFYSAIGQYEFYRAAMTESNLDFPLYLAVPETAFIRLNADPSIRRVVRTANIRFVVIDIEREEIIEWIG